MMGSQSILLGQRQGMGCRTGWLVSFIGCYCRIWKKACLAASVEEGFITAKADDNIGQANSTGRPVKGI